MKHGVILWGTGFVGKMVLRELIEHPDFVAKPLARGLDVVNTSVFPLIHPKSAPSSFVAPIERACREGGSSFFTTGIDPASART